MTNFNSRSSPRAAVVALKLVLALLLCTSAVEADVDGAPPQRRAPADFRSKHFLLHTDLAPREAEALLVRLERVLQRIAVYFGRQPRGTIEAYVVERLANWPENAFPHPMARVFIDGVGGATPYENIRDAKPPEFKATIYVKNLPGAPEHEAVHAYCIQTFGTYGPDWYKEGMAEVARYGQSGSSRVDCPKEMVDYLRSAPARRIEQIVSRGTFTALISESLLQYVPERHIFTAESLKAPDKARIEKAKQSYRWSWALCHFLSSHPRYRDRFRHLGRSFLNRENVSLEQSFADVAGELSFEFRFFLERFDNGYDVARCAWDWETEFRPLRGTRPVTVKVFADRGFQATGYLVSAGQAYEYRTSGTWRLTPRGRVSTADGTPSKSGRLVGVVMSDYELGEPFELGTRGTFIAPADGGLYFRCQDAWNELHDNRGTVIVRFRRTP